MYMNIVKMMDPIKNEKGNITSQIVQESKKPRNKKTAKQKLNNSLKPSQISIQCGDSLKPY